MCKVRKTRTARVIDTPTSKPEIDLDQVIHHEREQGVRFLRWLVWASVITVFVLLPVNVLTIPELRPARDATGFLAEIHFSMGEESGWAAFGVISTLVVALQIAVRSTPRGDVDLDASIARQIFLENIAVVAGLAALVVASLVAFGDGFDLSSIDIAGQILPVGVGVLIAAFACDASWASRDRFGKAIGDRKREIARERLKDVAQSLRESTRSSQKEVMVQVVVIVLVLLGSIAGFGILVPRIGVPLTALLELYCLAGYVLFSWQARDSIIRGNLTMGYAQYVLLGFVFCLFWLSTASVYMKVFVQDWRDFVIALTLAFLLQCVLLLVAILMCMRIPGRRTRGLMLSVILRSLTRASASPTDSESRRPIARAAWFSAALVLVPPASIAAGVIALRDRSISRGSRALTIGALSFTGLLVLLLVAGLVALAWINPDVQPGE